ncbi:MAG: hypothetical protein IPG64_15455 [Haliea sp.]|nr:hypothetical protein [Haliea sp.]
MTLIDIAAAVAEAGQVHDRNAGYSDVGLIVVTERPATAIVGSVSRHSRRRPARETCA